MSQPSISQRGRDWFHALCGSAPLQQGLPPSLLVADGELAGQPARYIAVVADPHNPFERARHGEVGLLEGWALAAAIDAAVQADQQQTDKRAIVAIIDVPSQAYGRREEAYGIHQALAAAAAAYAGARLAGHPVIGLIVGKAMSGAFLAHGYQANRLLALDDAGVMVHAMGKQAAARITLRSVDELETLAASIAPMAYDIASYASLGLLWRLLETEQPDQPTPADVQQVRTVLAEALHDIQADPQRDLRQRLHGEHRQATRRVRALLQGQWSESGG
ncbi:biotin-independent malonate decarboxylase subunit gamma [Aquitalea palustris]|uniref:Biotin-independent malonate decarboxylase subunit gamma n=1 Tax=Aquitalea palustris TaxID=2480983 RepID=A0A454JDP8_9NEIS|nr:biotin-independent malonate decarboxylase subunit gamma [Aquitalea palustris]RMC91934.1 biotin-independent malonate decarboxylase subunit gamma [Aquitalea palustris]